MTNITMLGSFSQLTRKQVNILEAEFSVNTRPDITSRDRLAHTLKLSNLLIHVWFQIRRLRLRHRPNPKAALQTSNDDINEYPEHLTIPNRTYGKRKSPCDISEYEWTSHLCKKSSTAPASMSVDSLSHNSRPSCLPVTSSSYHPSVCGAIQERASRDTPSGATSSLMSVDFLSRSSRSAPVCIPSNGVGYLSRMPMFYLPAALQPVAHYLVN